MQNFIELPTSNTFEEKSKEFYQSKLAQRLKKKFEPKPFEENYKAVFYIALVTSYCCNGFSILTASTFTFSYLYSIFAKLPYPIWWAVLFSGIVLILIEALQRIITPKLFKNSLQYGFKLSSLITVAIILSLSGLSIFFSYNGGFDVVEKLTQPPTYTKPNLRDIEQIRTEYKSLIADADKDAKDYRDKKLYLGRLSDKHVKVYHQLLEKKASLQTKMIDKINLAENQNTKTLSDAKTEHKEALASYQNSVTIKGGGLASFTIIAQLLFFISIFFMEFFDYKTASQYAIITSPKNESKASLLEIEYKPISANGNTTKQADIRNQIGFKSGSDKPAKSQLEQKETDKTKTVLVQDKHTIEHNGKRYTLNDVNNFINIYSKRVEEAKKNDKFDLAANRTKTLEYWKSRKTELQKA